jgi:multiple sugar transport system substrate-binding protein
MARTERRMRLRLGAAVASVGLLAGVLAGCGSSSKPASASSAVTHLSIWSCQGCPGSGFPKLISAFEASHPNIKISTRFTIPFANYDTTLSESFAGNSGPDIVWINSSGDYGLYSSKGYLKDLSKSIVGAPNVVPTDFYPNEWKEVALSQGTFGVPIDTGTRALYWNKTLFKEAHVAPFGETATWSQVLDAAKKIDALGHGISGFRYPGGEKWSMLYLDIGPLVFEAGGQIINSAGTKAYATSPQVEKAADYWNQLIKYAPKADVTQQNQTVPVDAFADNKAGMYYNGFWDIGAMQAVNPKVKFGETLMKDVTVDSNTGGWILSVPSYVSSSKIAAIKEFYSYVFSPKHEISLTGIMPAVKASTKLDSAIQGPEYNIFWKILKENAQQPIPLTANMYPEAVDILNAMESTALGKSVPAEMKSLQQKLNGLVVK